MSPKLTRRVFPQHPRRCCSFGKIRVRDDTFLQVLMLMLVF